MNRKKAWTELSLLSDIRNDTAEFIRHGKLFIRWVFLGIITGLFVGLFSAFFALCLAFVTKTRGKYPWLLYLLPAAGLLIVFLYRHFKAEKEGGTNLLFLAIYGGEKVPFHMAPLIFISTLLTHITGGSAGREGAALQLGGSIGYTIGSILKLDEQDKKIITMAGMSAAFGAVFGTPMAAVLFPIEVISVGVLYYVALVPCIVAALIGYQFAGRMGIDPEAFSVNNIPELSVLNLTKIALLAILCACLSTFFCQLLHRLGADLKKLMPNPYVMVVVCSIIIIAINKLLGTTDYLGAGIPVIERAMFGEVVWYAFLVKMLLTALTLAAGFKGGEIVPVFFVGATFGCLAGHILGISPSMCAAIGMTAMFCGAVNCPMTSMLLSLEIFGMKGALFFFTAICISYMFSGYSSLYKKQKFTYSKYKAKYINKPAK